jgi:hypothetical protein
MGRVGGGGEEAHFIEETCTEGLYPCSLTAVEVVKITCRGLFQRGCNGRGVLAPCNKPILQSVLGRGLQERGVFWEVGV